MIQDQTDCEGVSLPRIAVYHRTSLMYQGGGEAVCIQTLEALKSDYEVTLLTVGKEIDFKKINQYFGTNLKREEIHVKHLDHHPVREIRYLLKKIGGILPIETEFLRLRSVLIDWYLARIDDSYDLLVSTLGESPYHGASIDYVHYPSDYVYYHTEDEDNYGPYMTENNETPFYFLYDKLVNYLFPNDRYRKIEKTTLVNSNWTGRSIKEAYGVDYKVVYPPVRTEDFDPPPWKEKQDGVVCIGRVIENKRVLRTVEILDKLRERYDLHLHIVGIIPDTGYAREVIEKAEDKPYIRLEGRVSREKLIRLVEEHKFGIHGMDVEHFGIAVAEMVAGGCIPFVPDDGGQVEIVEENSDLLYSDKDEAVSKISRILEDPELERETAYKLRNRAEEFSAKKYRSRIRKIVANKLKE